MAHPSFGPTPGEGANPGEARLRRALEAMVMVAEEPVPAATLAAVLDVEVATVERLLAELALDYDASGRGFILQEVAGGWRFASHPEFADEVERLLLEGRSARLSAAALETLAIIAYRQPISRAQIASIRGVNVDGVVRTLVQRGLVAEVGRDDGPGQAILYGTTPQLLIRLGLRSLDELPPLADHVPDAATVERLERDLVSGAGGSQPGETGPTS